MDVGLGDTKRRIMDLLLDGPGTAAEIAEKLEIQKSAARIHLESLQAEYIVKSSFKSKRLGRPRKVYELSEFGRELFPRRYDLILNRVLEKIVEKEGKEVANGIIESIADDMAAGIRDKIGKSSNGSLKDSLAILNSESDKLGFASSLVAGTEGKAAGGQSDTDGYSILSKNCILAKVATENQEAICHRLHSRIIAKSLDGGHDIGIELRECMALGDTFCRHVITEKRKNNKRA